MSPFTLVAIAIALVFLSVEMVSAVYRRWGDHFRPSRHPWVWGMLGYLVAAQVLDIIWPWRGWSLHVAIAAMFIACAWLTTLWVNRLERS